MMNIKFQVKINIQKKSGTVFLLGVLGGFCWGNIIQTHLQSTEEKNSSLRRGHLHLLSVGHLDAGGGIFFAETTHRVFHDIFPKHAGMS